MPQTKKVLELGGRRFVLIGTAHVSKESCDEVEREIHAESPDCVAIELDEQRLASLNDTESWRNLDIIKVLREKKGFLLLANLVLAGFQRRMGVNIGVRPGDEMRAGIRVAQELGIPAEMVDRPIQTTLRRAWAKTSFLGKSRLLAALLASAFDKEEISTQQIEELKTGNEMDSMMHELSDYMPAVKEVLIDERDFYLAAHIWQCLGGRAGSTVVAVLGAGHLAGVEAHLAALAAGTESPDTTEISGLPPRKTSSKVFQWAIPALIVALIVAGFVLGGRQKGADMVGAWFLWNGLLAGLGTAIAAGHPLTILTGVVGAPFTSLCPFIGVGFFTGIVQAVLVKPKVRDLETVQDDISGVRGVYRNRVLRVLLVFVLSSVGSSVGTFVAGSSFVVTVAEFFTKLF